MDDIQMLVLLSRGVYYYYYYYYYRSYIAHNTFGKVSMHFRGKNTGNLNN